MQLRELSIGCVGGGTGLPSLIGGLKSNPWLSVNAVVTMFDSGGSSGQLRDELGVLPPGDVLKCALALARNEGEARRVLLSRLPTLEHHARLAGHTGGNLLLSMMEQYSGDFLAAVDGLRALLGCRGRVWPVSIEPASICAEYGDGTETRGEVEVGPGRAGAARGDELVEEVDPRFVELLTRSEGVQPGGDVETERQAKDLPIAEPLEQCVWRVTLQETEVVPEHLAERPVRDAPPVGEAPAR
jgi:hypothetical protein